MLELFKTRDEIRGEIREWSNRIGAALVGIGLALAVSIIFLGAGAFAILLGIGVFIGGWVLSVAFPVFLPYRPVQCPNCRKINEVLGGVEEFECDQCASPLRVGPELLLGPARVSPKGPVTERKLLMYLAALSYVAFFLEVYLGHYRFILTQSDLRAMIPVYFSPVALVVALFAATWVRPGTVAVFNTVMWLSVSIGLLGTFFHLAPRDIGPLALLSIQTWLASPPILAPLSFALPGIIGLIGTYRLEWVYEKAVTLGLPEAQPAVGAK